MTAQLGQGRTMMTRRGFVASSAMASPAALLGVPLLKTSEPQAEQEPAKVPRRMAGPPPGTMPAFPGAEGAGMYTTGGRGGEVYEVTTLADSGPGSLRDAVSASNRTIVFRVSGNIELQGGLDIIGSNLTLAGQTAPGDGICITTNQTEIKGSNIIIRYLRFRAGDVLGSSIDTANGRGVDNILIDHCSFSWGVDETFSLYGNTNMTVQWCIIAEGLTMSAHEKGRHGYGGLWGGDNVTYHHNLLIHNGGRNPRFSFTEGMDMKVDLRNNVIYNYGYTSGYGGEWSNGVNIVGNYYKYGPDTVAEIAPVIFAPGRFGQWYVADNYVDGHPEVTEDNWRGIELAVGGITKLDDPVKFPSEIATQSAQGAYEAVLANVGAILPRRDACDARLINDVRRRTGRLINSQDEVGGWPPLTSAPAPTDSDHDGMPDEWEVAEGLDPNDPTDASAIAPAGGGYTNLERYLNSITPIGAGNPTVEITRPLLNQVYATTGSGQDVTIEAAAAGVDGESITKVEFYNGAQKLGEATEAPYRYVWTGVADGSYYLTARATDSGGTATTSSAVPVHINQVSAVRPWQSRDIGNVPIPGSVAVRNNVFTIKGSGKIQGRSDSFHYVYQPFDARPGQISEITARVDYVSRVYVDVMAGLMIRESLAPDSPFMMIGISYSGSGKIAKAVRIANHGSKTSDSPFPWDGTLDNNRAYWLRLIKRGSEFEAFVSSNSLHWDRVGYERIDMPDRLYIGFAVDGNQQSNQIHHYTTARFSLVQVNL
ncbi:Ig-like domain-containing protein [Actinopolymorpha sp. B11F2]|uniref:Ig-like domain-containing protein n=1 Tax=Actinopolymorpha sp. B11F2 TaxID=3160862 RepID=UPI0032E45454